MLTRNDGAARPRQPHGLVSTLFRNPRESPGKDCSRGVPARHDFLVVGRGNIVPKWGRDGPARRAKCWLLSHLIMEDEAVRGDVPPRTSDAAPRWVPA